MKVKTTAEILAEVGARGEITEREISLLKCRSNRTGADLWDYEIEGVKVSAAQGQKGLNWLRSLLRRDGSPRKGVSLGYREVEIINSATADDFEFHGFYNAGRWNLDYLPVYSCKSMEYIPYGNGEKIYIIG